MDFKTKTETVGGVEYTLTEPEGGVALSIQEEFSDQQSPERIMLWGDTLIASALGISVDEFRKWPLSIYNEARVKLSPIALDLFGLKVVTPGETKAGENPA